MKNIIIISLTMVGVSLLAGCKSKNPDGQTEGLTRVKTICVAPTDLSSSGAYSGTIEASAGTSLSFPVAGTLVSLTVDEGDFVTKGTLVARLDDRSLKSAWEITKSALDEAQDAYNRMKMLHDSNSLPEMQWVDVQNTLKQAQSAEQIARKAMNDANLYAPVSGYVSEKMVQTGMTVAPIQPVVEIVTIDPVKVNISVSEDHISDIVEGTEANITVDALDGASYKGRVTERGVTASPLSRAYQVKISVDNPGHKLLPGMICDVALQGAEPEHVVVLPVNSVLLDSDNTNFVWLASDGKAVKRTVTTGDFTDSGIIITGGIAPGDSVIVEGQQKVSSGTPIQAI